MLAIKKLKACETHPVYKIDESILFSGFNIRNIDVSELFWLYFKVTKKLVNNPIFLFHKNRTFLISNKGSGLLACAFYSHHVICGGGMKRRPSGLRQP